MARFSAWRRGRPLVGGLLLVLAGIEMFLSSQLDLGNIKIQLGIEGLQAVVIPVALILLGLLAATMPQHRVFYGILGLVVAIYAIVGLNLGGFLLGTILGSVGGVLTVAWMPRAAGEPTGATAEDESAGDVPAENLPAGRGSADVAPAAESLSEDREPAAEGVPAQGTADAALS